MNKIDIFKTRYYEKINKQIKGEMKLQIVDDEIRK